MIMNTTVLETPSMKVFDELESEVRSYCRSFTTVFDRAKDHKLWDTDGTEYIDFFAGAGSLNYGHNNEKIKQKLVEYILSDGITHSLDMATKAKEHFLTKFNETILLPRGMDHKVMFPGPTGTNSVESALKIARKVTGRESIISFTNAFHGMTIGSLSITGNKFKREGAGIPLTNGVFMPFDNYFGEDVDTADYLEKLLDDSGSGISIPAAIIFETVQGEGGVNVATNEWMQKIEKICRDRDIVLIVDDVQMGCGRTGTFFSFEPSGIKPDIVCLSKSIGGIGMPFALTLLKPELDIWAPGEHNGTFRGNNLAFVAAAAALDYWKDGRFSQEIATKSEFIRSALQMMADQYPELKGTVRGRGMIQGIKYPKVGIAEAICAEAFKRGLIMETSGTDSEVAKLLPPLTIDQKGLEQGLKIMAESIKAVSIQLKK
jgi:diaminobutyrate-2-oxoglutarate transaminase